MEKNQRKIKICYVVTIDITIKLILLNYLKLLKSENYETWVVCSSGPFLEDIRKEGIKIKTIKITRRITPISDLRALFQLIYFFKKEKFDIVQTQTPKAGFLGQLAAKLAGVPIIINNNFGFYFQKNSPWLKKRFFILLEKIAAKCSDLAFFINREDIQTAIKEKICQPEKVKYLGYGIDFNRFNPERFSADLILKKKKELGIPPSKTILGIIARLVAEKGYLELFEAFQKVIQKFPETLLLIIGYKEPEKEDGISIEITKKYGIEKNILFLGERKDVDEIYPLMDIFILPSHREGLGNTILEASAMRRPVIATDIRGCRESVDDRKTGILVPPKNPAKLAEAIIYLLENPKIWAELGEAGRKKIEKDFGEELVFNRMKEEYQRLVQEKIK